MKDAVLIELAARWEREAKPPNVENGSDDYKIPNAVAKGRREGMRECADTLRSLVSMLGEPTGD